MKKHFIGLALTLCCLMPASLFGEANLYGPKGVTPEAVSQGMLGSCYFHATIAALAHTHPEALRAAISQNGKNYTVSFADGKQENVYPDDVRFARDSYYDASDGLWVAVLFRGYAQRTLRAAMLAAIDKSSMPVTLKLGATGILRSSDFLLLAYDRAIRYEIDQAGNVTRDGLKTGLREEFKSIPGFNDWKDRAIEMLDSAGFFSSLAESVKTNSHLYGAYRAVGQGGVVEDVFRAFSGSGVSYNIKSAEQASAEISAELKLNRAVVAWTGESPVEKLTARWGAQLGNGVEDWYYDSHAYTVLSVDPRSGTVRLRNPGGRQPEPDGEFSLPWRVFSMAYAGYSTSATRRAMDYKGRP
jgi:hypothetical protein